MLNTVTVKRKLYDGFFSVGDPASKEVVLMFGSCRGMFYLNYLHIWNEANGRPLLIYYIDPYDYHWDRDDKLQDPQAAILAMESDPLLLDIFKRTRLFIHEYYKSFGMFNTSSELPKNAFQFGLQPRLDIGIPNWHGKFIWANDVREFKPDTSDIDVILTGNENIRRFVSSTRRSSVPEFADYFADNWRKRRLFYSFNHVSSEFAMPVWQLINDKYLHLRADNGVADAWSAIRMYESGSTRLTDLDVYGYMLEFGMNEINNRNDDEL